MLKNITTQMSSSNKIMNFKSYTVALKNSLDNTMVATIGANLILAGSLQKIWSLVNSLQLIMYFPLLNITFPTNAKYFYSIILPLSSLELIPQKYTTELFFTITEENDYPHNDDFETMGYETHNAL
jgi:hypothetical protein